MVQGSKSRAGATQKFSAILSRVYHIIPIAITLCPVLFDKVDRILRPYVDIPVWFCDYCCLYILVDDQF
jgi:hypothetical protein